MPKAPSFRQTLPFFRELYYTSYRIYKEKYILAHFVLLVGKAAEFSPHESRGGTAALWNEI